MLIRLFYLGIVGLLLFEITNVYFIMPMPGSQRMESLDTLWMLTFKKSMPTRNSGIAAQHFTHIQHDIDTPHIKTPDDIPGIRGLMNFRPDAAVVKGSKTVT